MMRHLVYLLIAAFGLAALPAAAEDYPTRPIRAIDPQGPGGLSDIFLRALGEELGTALGQPIVVENRTGASGSLGAKACADAAPDGYTICVLNNESMAINPWIFKNMKFDPKKDVTPVTRLFNLQQVFAVNASLKVKSFDELAALAKSKPKTMTYLAPSLSKVAFMENFNKQHGVDFVRVPFKGGGDAVNNMLSGVTPVAIFGIGNLIQFIRNKQIIGFAVDGDKRSPLAPEIPTFIDLGYKELVNPTYFGIFAPAGTPKPIIDKLHAAIVKVASKPEFQQRHMTPRGIAPVLNSPDAFAKELDGDRAEGLAVVKASGLYPNVK
jgi:tripartite-type tricarboxylate transporter receptor subunit TctC